jgi:hypothetical protein
MDLSDMIQSYMLISGNSKQVVESIGITSNPSTITLFALFVLFIFSSVFSLIKLSKKDIKKVYLYIPVSRIHNALKKIYQQIKNTFAINDLIQRVIGSDISLFDKPVSLHYVQNTENETAELLRNRIHVRIKQRENENVDFVLAAAMCVEIGFLHNGKAFLHPTVSKACNLVMVRKIIEAADRRGLNYFLRRFIKEYIGDDQEIYSLYYTLMELDRRGLFIPILIKQTERIARIATYPERNLTLRNDFYEFLLCLTKICRLNTALSINTAVCNTYFRTAILSFNNLNHQFGPMQLLDQILSYRREGYAYIYLFTVDNHPCIIQKLLDELPIAEKYFSSINITRDNPNQLYQNPQQTICIEFSAYN